MDLLKFVVLDEEDLEVVSAHVQDAVVKAAEVMWRPQEKRLVVALNRFDWEGAQAEEPEFRRRRAALRFERVLSCKCRDIDGQDAVLNLLAIEFSETDAPSGVVTLDVFRRGGAAAGRRMPGGGARRPRPDLDGGRLSGACPRRRPRRQDRSLTEA